MDFINYAMNLYQHIVQLIEIEVGCLKDLLGVWGFKNQVQYYTN